mgnify:CR=1 FL=1
MAVKEVHGPGPRGARGPRPKVENPGKLLKRIMDEVFRNYLPHCILVLVCIVVSALANVQASLFLQTLMDDYIVPMTRQQNPSFAPLAGALVRMCCIYLVGILAAWANARIMVNVTQGTLRNLRTKLFTHMESLPIRYFDSHPHGDIMSVYTNDVDTLRQMIGEVIGDAEQVSSAATQLLQASEEVSTAAQQQSEGPQQDRLSRTRLPREDVQVWIEFQFERLDQGVILDFEALEHVSEADFRFYRRCVRRLRFCTSGAAPRLPTGRAESPCWCRPGIRLPGLAAS